MPTPPTLINLPPPPSDPLTPSDAPGTPNSATTSMSELSTVAIKDGHRGHLPHTGGRNALHPDAERADRISRLAGLERVATAAPRQPTPINQLTPGAAAPPGGVPSSTSGYGGSNYQGGGTGAYQTTPGVGYFDAAGNPLMGRERSTVGSASATGSVTGRTTTWASGSVSASEAYEGDEQGDVDGDVDMDLDRSSVGGVSSRGGNFADDDAGSLVGFGEGARTPARGSAYGSPSAPAFGKAGPLLRDSVTPTSTTTTAAGPQVEREIRDARNIDGVARDTTPAAAGQGTQVAERILRERIGDEASGGIGTDRAGSGLGKFEFERKG